MADWQSWWRRVRAMCDDSPTQPIELTVEEILEGAAARDNNVHEQWWWDLMMNPNAPSHTGVMENGMDCEQLSESGRIERVRFWITD